MAEDDPFTDLIKLEIGSDDEEFVVYKMLEGAEDIILDKEEDPLLSLIPVVYTTRLDEMNTIKQDLTNRTASEILTKLYSESKPIVNTENIKPSPDTKNVESFIKLVSVISEIFMEKPQLPPNVPNEAESDKADDDIPIAKIYPNDDILPNLGFHFEINEEENRLNTKNIESFSSIPSVASDIKNLQLIPQIPTHAAIAPNISTVSSVNSKDYFEANKEYRPCYVVLEDIKKILPANQVTVKLPLRSNLSEQFAIDPQDKNESEVTVKMEIDQTSNVEVDIEVADALGTPISQLQNNIEMPPVFESNAPTNEKNSSSEKPQKLNTKTVKVLATDLETKGKSENTISSRKSTRKRKPKIYYNENNDDGSSDEDYVPDVDDEPIINFSKKPKTKYTLKTVPNVPISKPSNNVSNTPVVTVLTNDSILASFQEKFALIILMHEKKKTFVYRVNPMKLVTDYYITTVCDEYKLASMYPKEEKIIEQYCCWYTREKIIGKICSRKNYPFTIAKFLKQPHSCHPDECRCCCQTMNPDSSQCKRTERRAVMNKALKSADRWISELLNRTKPTITGLIGKALTYTPKAIKEKPVDKQSEKFMANYLLCIKNPSPSLMYELYEIGQNGDVFRSLLLYDKNEVACIRKMYQSKSMPIRDAELCCRFKREKLMHELKMLKTSPATLKHILKAHRCNSKCNCCCKPLPATLRAVQTLPATFKYTTAYKNNLRSLTIQFDKKSKKAILKGNTNNKSKKLSNNTDANTAAVISGGASKDYERELSISVLGKFKNLAVNSDGKLEVILNEPAKNLSVVELKELSDKLALSIKQQLELGLSAEEFCNRINSRSADIHVTPLEATLISEEKIAPLPLEDEYNDDGMTDAEDECRNVEDNPIEILPNQTIPTCEQDRITTQTKLTEPSRKTNVPFKTYNVTANPSIFAMISNLMETKNKNYVDSFKSFFNKPETPNFVLPNIKKITSTPGVPFENTIIEESPMPIIKETFTLANSEMDGSIFGMPGPSGVTLQGRGNVSAIIQSDISVNDNMEVRSSNQTQSQTKTNKRKMENIINAEIEKKIRVKPPSELNAPIPQPLVMPMDNLHSITTWPSPVVIKREPQTNIPRIVRPVGSTAITISQSLQKQTYVVANNVVASNLNSVGSTPMTAGKVFQMNGNPIQVSGNTASNPNGAGVHFLTIAPFKGQTFDASKKTMLAKILTTPQTPVSTSSGTHQVPPLVPFRTSAGPASDMKETSDQTQEGKSVNYIVKRYKK